MYTANAPVPPEVQVTDPVVDGPMQSEQYLIVPGVGAGSLPRSANAVQVNASAPTAGLLVNPGAAPAVDDVSTDDPADDADVAAIADVPDPYNTPLEVKVVKLCGPASDTVTDPVLEDTVTWFAVPLMLSTAANLTPWMSK